MKIFKVIRDLLGHNTLRNVFYHMMDFYEGPNGFAFDITTARSWEEISKFVNQFGIEISSYNPNLARKQGDLSADQTIGRHRFTLYFGDIDFVFLVKNKEDLSNKVQFSSSVPSFIGPDFSYSRKSFGLDLLAYFTDRFKDFKSSL
ncbi:hypothetical protein ES703_79879 [subsurface metagenome]